MFLLWLRQFPQCGDRTPASVPPPAKGRSSPTNTPVFSPSFFILLSFAWFYIFFSSGQVLLTALSWCSACTSVSKVIFLNVSVERDVLHVHLLLHRLVLSIVHFITIIIISAPPQIILEVEYPWPNWYLFANHSWLFFKIRSFKFCFLMEILCQVLWSKSFK